MKEIPKQFVESFVMKDARERVVHEWKKNPEKLFLKVCHSPGELFKSEFKAKQPTIDPNESCYYLAGRNIHESTFSEAEKWVGIGSGVLIVTTTGSKFYAESESTKGHPSISYAGG